MSSRSSSYNHPKNYDVFLNFRGIDTRVGFTNHLYFALDQQNYKTFIDNIGLERGKVISKELLEAIENSRCSIAVISENYASSTACLRELAKMVECKNTSGQIILPVFYHLEPHNVKELRIQTYKEEFEIYETDSHKYDYNEVQSWKNALKTVCGLAGWTIKKTEIEADKIKDIIEKLSRKLHVQDKYSGNNEPTRQSHQLPDVVALDRSLVTKTVGDSNSSSLGTSLPSVIVKDPSNPNIFYTPLIPGSKIPTWITKTSPKPLITIKLDPNWSRSSDSIGLALCVSLRAKPSDSFSCEMNFGNNKWENSSLFCCEHIQWSEFVWLFFLARDHLPAEWLQSSYGKLKVSLHAKTLHPDTSCGACGYSLLYRKDIEILNQIARNIYIQSTSQNVDSSSSKFGNDMLNVASTNYKNYNLSSQSQMTPPNLQPMSMLGCSSTSPYSGSVFDSGPYSGSVFDSGPYMGVNYPPAVQNPWSPYLIDFPDVDFPDGRHVMSSQVFPGGYSFAFSSSVTFPQGGHQINQWPWQ